MYDVTMIEIGYWNIFCVWKWNTLWPVSCKKKIHFFVGVLSYVAKVSRLCEKVLSLIAKLTHLYILEKHCS